MTSLNICWENRLLSFWPLWEAERGFLAQLHWLSGCMVTGKSVKRSTSSSNTPMKATSQNVSRKALAEHWDDAACWFRLTAANTDHTACNKLTTRGVIKAQHSPPTFRQSAPANGLFCACYESFCLIKLRIDKQSQTKLLLLFLNYQGDGWRIWLIEIWFVAWRKGDGDAISAFLKGCDILNSRRPHKKKAKHSEERCGSTEKKTHVDTGLNNVVLYSASGAGPFWPLGTEELHNQLIDASSKYALLF